MGSTSFSLVASLKSCAKKKDLLQGIRIHAEVCTDGTLQKNPYVGHALISMYAKCGALTNAVQVLHDLPIRDVVLWSTLIAGYVQQGHGKEALECFGRMRNEGISPNAITYTYILKACGITKEVDKGKQIHHEIADQGLLESDGVLGNTLVDMYGKCGALTKARQVFDNLHGRDVVSWSALIAGYTQRGHGKEALELFQQMQGEGLSPNAITYSCVLKACGITKGIEEGKQIHDEIVNQGLLKKSIALGNALVDMYAKCGMLSKAQRVVDELPIRSVVAWSSLIGGYTQQRQGKEALDCYQRMRSEGIAPNAVTYACILKACGIRKEVDRGKQIHDEIVSQGLLEKDIVLGNALLDMYAKCGMLAMSQQVLDELHVRDVVSWSALIGGYVQQGMAKEAIDCFDDMQGEGISPNEITYVCVLKACGIMKDSVKGKQIHDEVLSRGLQGETIALGNALVDMYAKCSMLMQAQAVNDLLPVRDVVSWSALIGGYAQQGQGKEAMDCFHRMRSEGLIPDLVSWNAVIGGFAQQGEGDEALECFRWMLDEGVSPDAATFGCVLHSCSHSGLVDEGQMYFEVMGKMYEITADVEHQACMIDLFGRAGQFDKVMALIQKIPTSDYPPLWSALMGACQKWGNMKLGRLAFEHARQLDESDAVAYVSLGNMYRTTSMPEVVLRLQS